MENSLPGPSSSSSATLGEFEGNFKIMILQQPKAPIDPDVKIEIDDDDDDAIQAKMTTVKITELGVLKKKHLSPVTQLQYYSGCEVLFCGYGDGSIITWKNFGHTDKVTDWTIVKKWLYFYASDDFSCTGSGSVKDMTISADGHYLAVATLNKSAYLWDLLNLSDVPVRKLENAHDKGVLSVSISSDNGIIATSSQDESVKLWDLRDGGVKGTFQCFADWVRRVRFNPVTNDNNLIALEHRNVKIWDVVDNKSSIYPLNSSVKDGVLVDLAFSNDGKWFASGGSSKKIHVWNYQIGRPYSDFYCHSSMNTMLDDTVNSLSFCPTGVFIAAAAGGDISIWNFMAPGTGVNVARIQGTCKEKDRKCISVTWSRDGELLFGGYSDAFQFSQFVRYVISPANDNKIVLQASCWVYASGFSLAILIKIFLKRLHLIDFLNNWASLEYEILGDQDAQTVKAAMDEKSRLIFKTTAFFVVAIMCTVPSILLHHLTTPRFPEYLYSLLPPTKESRWLLRVSLIHQVLLCILAWTHVILIWFIILNFSKSITTCLNILMKRRESKLNIRDITHELDQLDWKIKCYLKLEQLMTSFNDLFQWQILTQVFGVVIHLCIFIYIPLRHWKTTEPTSLLLFLVDALLAVVGIIGHVYPTMGMVFEVSSGFRRALKEQIACVLEAEIDSIEVSRNRISASTSSFILRQSFNFNRSFSDEEVKMKIKRLKLLISTCAPFGFRGASFFTFKSYTLLTVLSTVTTYIIVMLQLDI
ncbi:unnamed protein product [Orchesella dallaii]|uniref:Small ribosomal subunit protein RACK1 n=1 Tax=Orchesella dallaii TaxID=48710 RepID=A0ABP1Q303_9HEXA